MLARSSSLASSSRSRGTLSIALYCTCTAHTCRLNRVDQPVKNDLSRTSNDHKPKHKQLCDFCTLFPRGVVSPSPCLAVQDPRTFSMCTRPADRCVHRRLHHTRRKETKQQRPYPSIFLANTLLPPSQTRRRLVPAGNKLESSRASTGTSANRSLGHSSRVLRITARSRVG